MKSKLLSILLCTVCAGVMSAGRVSARELRLIPYPETLEQGEGSCLISERTRLTASRELKELKPFYRELLETATGFALSDRKTAAPAIRLKIDRRMACPSPEGYALTVSPGGIEIAAPKTQGIFYGLQTLIQLLEPRAGQREASVPAVRITDAPRFAWRGCMLDVSRTFMNKNLVMRYIDLMSHYKLNVLHLHFADDQGWRLEIKRYPKLTSAGSLFDAGFNEMGGYYTQEEMKEIIRFASRRNITIVPEFEMPGHSSAAIVSYPELSCRDVRPKIHPYLKGKGIHNEIFCAGKPEVYGFIYHVLDEIMALFPSEYIHIGGDEVPKTAWKACRFCQQAIRDNRLKDEEELQSHFVRKIGEYLRSKGRILIGWDEILDGGRLAGDEVIMFWRSWMGKAVGRAAEEGFRIIACPNSHCYLDYDYNRIDSEKLYRFEPVTTPAAAGRYLGVQANFWSHIDRCEKRIDGQLFPRLLALAEVAWTKAKDWPHFRQSARSHCERLEAIGIHCHHDSSLYDPE